MANLARGVWRFLLRDKGAEKFFGGGALPEVAELFGACDDNKAIPTALLVLGFLAWDASSGVSPVITRLHPGISSECRGLNFLDEHRP